jgi:colanic acid/amylovoran biosynthesis glycosyltransferase
LKNPLSIAIYSGVSKSTTFIERLISGLSNRDIVVYIFGVKLGKTKATNKVKYFTYGGKFHKLYVLVKYSTLLFLFKNADKKRIDKFLKEKKRSTLYNRVKYYPVLWVSPDIFHIQWAKALEEWIWVQDFGIKLVVSLRGAHINYSPIADSKLALMYQHNFPKVDHFHAVSKAIGVEAEKYHAPKEKISVVYSGLNLDKFEKQSQTKNKMFEIISIGRPHWKKGYQYALDACKILKDENIKFKYVIVGGAHNIELAYQVKDLALQDEDLKVVKFFLPINKFAAFFI